MTDVSITFRTESGDQTVSASLGATLLSVAQTHGISIDAPCGGNGTCGKCKVHLLEGALEHEAASSAVKLEDDWFLACKSTVTGAAVVELPGAAQAWANTLKIVPSKELEGDTRWQELSKELRQEGLLPAWQGTLPYALACDVGTTGVSMLLVDLTSGKALAQANTGNAQVRYGADIINRIINQTRPGGIERLKQAIVKDTLNPLITAVCTEAHVVPEDIAHVIIAGNTTMEHLLLGVEADSLRKEPFVPAFLVADEQEAGSIGLELPPQTPVYLAPNVGSYVGGDITAGLLASGMWNTTDITLFIDLGTNGELVFGNEEFMLTCACSAGPAFEGGDISSGMRATDGAIEAVVIEGASFDPQLSVIGRGKPAGLCGSGLIDVISQLFKTGAIDGKGRIVATGPRFIRDAYGIGSYIVAFANQSATGQAVTLSEVDIENFVRAKGAIFSAIMTMLDATGYTVEDLTQVQVAGGIGSNINIGNAISIGLLPDIAHERYAYLGNTSLNGAHAMALSNDVRIKVLDIAQQMTYLELSTEPGYMDAFVAACFIPHTNAALFPSVS